MRSRAHVIFYGRVQGVWFRSNTERKAVEEGLTGWVQNLPDGSVEALFEGDKNTIQSVIDWCQHDQPYARVDRIELSWHEFKDEYNGFRVLR